MGCRRTDGRGLLTERTAGRELLLGLFVQVGDVRVGQAEVDPGQLAQLLHTFADLFGEVLELSRDLRADQRQQTRDHHECRDHRDARSGTARHAQPLQAVRDRYEQSGEQCADCHRYEDLRQVAQHVPDDADRRHDHQEPPRPRTGDLHRRRDAVVDPGRPWRYRGRTDLVHYLSVRDRALLGLGAFVPPRIAHPTSLGS